MKLLTWGEEYVLTKLVAGDSPKEIAHQRGVTITTISKMCRNAKDKLGAKTTYQVVAMFAAERAKK